jgi:hypothetical protein
MPGVGTGFRCAGTISGRFNFRAAGLTRLSFGELRRIPASLTGLGFINTKVGGDFLPTHRRLNGGFQLSRIRQNG